MTKKRKSTKQTEGKPGSEKKEPDFWVIRPDDELKQLMREALQAIGGSRTDLIYECVRAELAGVVRRILEERKEAQERFLKGHGEKSQPEGNASPK